MLTPSLLLPTSNMSGQCIRIVKWVRKYRRAPGSTLYTLLYQLAVFTAKYQKVPFPGNVSETKWKI